MISGDLSNNQAIDRETRTAYFLGALGSRAQRFFDTPTLSSHKCYKLLANLIWDWHFLSKRHNAKFAFPGIGDFVWMPHLYGALGKVAPSIREPSFPLEHGLFASLSSLTTVGIYRYYGLLEAVDVGNNRIELRFAKFIPFEIQRQSLVQENERHFWDQLADVYMRCSDDELNALASCRTAAATVESLIIQLIRWRHHMGEALHAVVEGRSRAPNVEQHFQQARFCMRQFFMKRDFWLGISTTVDRLRGYAVGSELEGFVPQVDGAADVAAHTMTELEQLLANGEEIHAVHYVCRQIHKKLNGEQRKPRRTEEELRRLASFCGNAASDEIFDPDAWHSLTFGGNDKAFASRALRLIEVVYPRIELQIGRAIPFQRAYYEAHVGDHYPLPRDHFERGF